MSAPLLGAQRAASGRPLPPPIYHLSGVAAPRGGDHSHDCWHVQVTHQAIPGYSLPMIVKAVPSQVTMAVELACGLAARELRLSVPQPGLVVAERQDLPGLSDDIPGDRLLLVGSHYQQRDALFAEVVDDPAAEEMVWQQVCATSFARQGAAWDELIANPDRHCENLLYDGTTWWLFDHDQALAPAAAYSRQHQEEKVRHDAIAHDAKVNQLARELLRRCTLQPEHILEASRRLDSGGRRLQALARYAVSWQHDDPQVQNVLQLVGVVLGLIHLRLPALAEKLHRRVGFGPARKDLWTSPDPKA